MIKNKSKFDKGFLLHISMLLVAFLFTLSLLVINGNIVNSAPIKVGDVATQKYVADRTVENIYATEKLQLEAAKSVGPLYKRDDSVAETTNENLDTFFLRVDEEIKSIDVNLENSDIEPSAKYYDINNVLNIPVAATSTQYYDYKMLSDEDRKHFLEEIKSAVNSAFEQGITEDTIEKSYEISDNYIDDITDNSYLTDNLREMAKALSRATIKPNLVLDNEAIEAAKKNKIDEVEPVMILKNQKIVDEGEIITAETYEILQSLGYTEPRISGNLLLFVISAVIILLMFAAFLLYVTTIQKKIFEERNTLIVMFFLYIVQLLAITASTGLENYALVPAGLFAMLATILIKPKTAIVLNIFVAVIADVVYGGNVDFLMYCLISGTFAASLVQYTNRRSMVFPISLTIGVLNAVTYVASCALMRKNVDVVVFQQSALAAASGVVSVIITVGSLPIWEAVFGINTKYRLAELANPNNELMRRLMIETPGTYHHCLIVANLAETAAYDIYANETLARTGAYYHDIGKLINPQYFSENQIDKNVHDQLDPYISAKVIIEHVENGLKLAEQYKLPKVIKDIIREHHGTTLVKYFYMKSAKEKPGDNTHESDFRYKGPIPQSKESAIVMLADTVEAAVRSTMSAGKDMEDVRELIDNLVEDKLNDGQLNDCRLDLKEIENIKKAFVKMFKGMYHERVAYPKAEDIKATIQAEKERGVESK